ncbi:FHA domain-containing protein [Enhydrobacter aerosaccus]|uniref:FHA domain-containing protein n=1 Tax=Enhydrobacter aerosaccus TaxID=225324 RepID=A0A1T4S0A8_9HYPH|nr:TIR domain-containing protein [Enhydrobacter aerosaccus]SKA21709.1 FHA domain-containing protein [Enhydrobacter aerosaccus]
MSGGTDYDIFISYTHEDTGIAKRLADDLAAQGWTVFWDRVLLPGSTWRSQIQSALVSAKVVVVLWSQRSVVSRWVEIEADHAFQRDAYLPATIDKAPLPLGLGHVQVADLREWHADPSAPIPDVLMSALRLRLGRPNLPPVPLPRPAPSTAPSVIADATVVAKEGIISLTGTGSDGSKYELSVRLSQLRMKPAGLVIGRQAGHADLVLADASVSRRHAMLKSSDGQITVYDLGSTNGTFVDNKPALAERPLGLVRGSVMRLGEVELIVQGVLH